MRLHRRNQGRIRLECRVHHLLVASAQRALDFGGHVIAPPAVQLVGVGHVARGLLEIRHEPAPLEHLREHVRDVFTRDVRAAELRDRIVAVLVEHLRVQLFGAFDADRRRSRRRAREIAGELVEEETAQRLRRSRVACEERALHRLGEVREPADVPTVLVEWRARRTPLA